MIIQHNSSEKIGKIESGHFDESLGCLCFAGEGHDYMLSVAPIKFIYLLDVNEDKIIEVARFWFVHSSDDLSQAAEDVISDVMDHYEIDRDAALDVLDGSEERDDWYSQQAQGVLAHALGYDCAESSDEQGVVYIAYCVGRDLKEVAA